MTTTQIRTEQEKLNKRIAEHQPDYDEAAARLEDAQRSFVNGKIDFAKRTSVQHEYDQIASVGASLLETAAKLQTKYEQASVREDRQREINRINTLAAEVQVELATYIEYRAETDRRLDGAGVARWKFTSKREELRALLRDLFGVDDFRVIPKGRRAEVEAIRAEITAAGFTEEFYRLATALGPDLPPLEYERAIRVAEDISLARSCEVTQRVKDAEQRKRIDKANKEKEGFLEKDRLRRVELARRQQRWTGGNKEAQN